MNTREFNIQFITPCFCAGADQTKAELRASAIRGQLRWWFRALGGGFDEEADVFGSVHQSYATASPVAVRVLAPPSGGEKNWSDVNKITRKGMNTKAYLLGFFCADRLEAQAALPPGSNAKVSLLSRRRLSSSLAIFRRHTRAVLRSVRRARG